MVLSPSAFDAILATGEARKQQSGIRADVFGVSSLATPSPVPYKSLEEAIASLRKAVAAAKSD